MRPNWCTRAIALSVPVIFWTSWTRSPASSGPRSICLYRKSPRVDGYAVVAHRYQDSAVENSVPLPEKPVGNPAARNSHEVHGRRVEAIDRRRCGCIEAEPAPSCIRHEENQQRPHAVVAESLPELREEQRGQAARMTADAGVILGNGTSGFNIS